MVLVCVMLLSVVAIGSEALAAGPWYNCNLTSVGSLPAPYNFFFINASAADGVSWTGVQTFLMDATDPVMKTLYAAALTGFANSSTCSLYLPYGPTQQFVSGFLAGPMN